MTRFQEAMETATRWKNDPVERDKILQRLTSDHNFPVYLSLLVEFRDDLMQSVADYRRSQEEREMDAGGLATALRMLDTVQGLMEPPPKEPEPKKE